MANLHIIGTQIGYLAKPTCLNPKVRSVIVIEHDMDFVEKIAEKVTVLHQGKLLAEGPMSEIKSNKEVIEVYLGH